MAAKGMNSGRVLVPVGAVSIEVGCICCGGERRDTVGTKSSRDYM